VSSCVSLAYFPNVKNISMDPNGGHRFGRRDRRRGNALSISFRRRLSHAIDSVFWRLYNFIQFDDPFGRSLATSMHIDRTLFPRNCQGRGHS
jgi:hypothetical protein